MVTFIIVNKGAVSFHTPADDWPLFPSTYFREHPKARLYRRDIRGPDWVEYFFDKARRDPRKVRCNYLTADSLPTAVKAAMLLNPI